MNGEELYTLIKEQQPNICQITAYKAGEKVYSECWNDYKADDCVHIMSATKSIMALLIGIALDKGQIGSVDDKVLDYFPDYKVKRGEKTMLKKKLVNENLALFERLNKANEKISEQGKTIKELEEKISELKILLEEEKNKVQVIEIKEDNYQVKTIEEGRF